MPDQTISSLFAVQFEIIAFRKLWSYSKIN